MVLYGDETIDVLNLLIALDDDNDLVLPTQSQIARSLIMQCKRENETQKQLAYRIGCTPSTLSMVISANNQVSRSLTRKNTLSMLLQMDPMPDVETINHALMSLRKPGLFRNTFQQDVNQQNQLLYELVNYARLAQQKPACGWLPVFQWVFEEVGLIEPKGVRLSREQLPANLAIRLRSWKASIQRVRSVDYSAFRNSLLDQYIARHEFSGRGRKSEAIRSLEQQMYRNVDSIESLFYKSEARNSRGSRSAIIQLAVALDCNLDDANLMLEQANFAVIYPKRQDDEELRQLTKMLQNGINGD